MESILIIGHGSPRKEANSIHLVGKLLHDSLHPGCDNGCVKAAYLEFGEPSIPDAIKACVESGSKRLIMHPYFLSPGMHVTKDIPEMIQEAEKTYPGVEFVYTEPLGIHEKLVQVMIERIHAANGLAPGEIETRSFEILSEETDLRGISPEHLPIVKRVIHATADFEFKNSLVFHPDAVAVGLAAIRQGKNILTDVEMVRTGINKRLLEKWGGKVVCNIQSTEDRGQSTDKRTRSEIGIEKAFKEDNNIGIIAIGNAPTALLKTIELLTNSELLTQPALECLHRGNSELLVVGVPVGFVKALESKALLSAQQFPFITNLSRKGGTPVAVAIVNALLKMAEEGK